MMKTKINGTGGRDTLTGSPADDFIRGGKGSDVLDGGQGADRLAGGQGADLIYGGSGADKLIGGAGRDIFFFREYDDGLDAIKDFEIGKDQIIVDVGPGLKTLTYDDGGLFILDDLGDDIQVATVSLYGGLNINLRPEVDFFHV